MCTSIFFYQSAFYSRVRYLKKHDQYCCSVILKMFIMRQTEEKEIADLMYILNFS